MISELTARASTRAGRPRLISPWALGAFAVLVLAPLAIVFPKEDLLRHAQQARLGDPLAVSYLENLLKGDQNDLGLRISLAEHKIDLGEMGGVPDLIAPALHSADPAWQARGQLTTYKYLTKQYALSRPGSPRQAMLMRQRRSMLAQLAARPWPIDTLAFLATQAGALHEHAIGMRVYRMIAESPDTSAPWCAAAAARILGEGDYELAALLYFTAREKEASLSGQRQFLIAGIRTLMANSMFREAMQAADQHLGNLARDSETLNFLIQAARAANDQKHAARYARMLLHVSWLGRVHAWFARLDLHLIASADAASLDKAEPGANGMGPFDAKKYQLAYDVFLENRDLADAFRVAEAAVRQRPNDAAWHRRLARVAEWVNKPQIALREWLWAMRHNGGEPALEAVLRIAPALDDYDAALEAWKFRADRHTMSQAQWNTLADLFEKTGKQREGIRFFEARYGTARTPVLLELAARLAERSGNDEEASRLYLRLVRLHTFSSDWVLKAANLLLQKGEYKRAYELLETNAAHIDKKNVTYWRLLADLAWQLQLDDEAVKRYRALVTGDALAKEDFARLISLLGESRPDEVAALAELAYRKFGDPGMLLRALEIQAARHDLVAQRRLFESISPDQSASLSGNAHFLLMRAQYLQACGAFAAARAAFRQGAAVAPNDATTMTEFLWFLIEAHQQTELRELMAQIAARGDDRNPAYWGAFAAAYEVLEQPSYAVLYYDRQVKQYGQDFLWLVNYADALEQDRQAAKAYRIRRYAWRQLRNKLGSQRISPSFSTDMLAAARLEILNQPGDPSLALVRSVLQPGGIASRNLTSDNQVGELVLAWDASNEQSFAAKAWLWQRYGHMLSRPPIWADAMVALEENDTERLDHLLRVQADGMPMLTRHDAASILSEAAYAQSIVFDGMTANPENDDAYARLSQDMLSTASFANFELRNEQFGTLRLNTQDIQVEAPIVPNVRLGAEFRHTRQSSVPLDLGSVPPTDQLAGLSMKIHSGAGDTELAARRRNEYANTTEARATHEMNVTPEMHVKLGAEVHGEATESNDLRVFGMRNQIEATLDYTFPERSYLSVQPGYARYYTQPGSFLGNGSHLSWELGHHFSVEYPDWRLAAIAINERFRADRTAVLPLPPNQNLYGVCFGMVEGFLQSYSRTWRPFVDACGTHNDVSGRGYIAHLGLAGPVAGHDRLSLTFNQEQGGVKVVGGLERELMVKYRYFFDWH